jgi:hypothetical protein
VPFRRASGSFQDANRSLFGIYATPCLAAVTPASPSVCPRDASVVVHPHRRVLASSRGRRWLTRCFLVFRDLSPLISGALVPVSRYPFLCPHAPHLVRAPGNARPRVHHPHLADMGHVRVPPAATARFSSPHRPPARRFTSRAACPAVASRARALLHYLDPATSPWWLPSPSLDAYLPTHARVYSRTHAYKQEAPAVAVRTAVSELAYMRETAADTRRRTTSATTATALIPAARHGAACSSARNSSGRPAHVPSRTASRRGRSTERNGSTVTRRQGQARHSTPPMRAPLDERLSPPRVISPGARSPRRFTRPHRRQSRPEDCVALRPGRPPQAGDPRLGRALLYRSAPRYEPPASGNRLLRSMPSQPYMNAHRDLFSPWKTEEPVVHDGVVQRAVAPGREHGRRALGR